MTLVKGGAGYRIAARAYASLTSISLSAGVAVVAGSTV